MKLTALILASAFAMAGTASADVTNPEDGITYNYLTAEWIRLDPDGGSGLGHPRSVGTAPGEPTLRCR